MKRSFTFGLVAASAVCSAWAGRYWSGSTADAVWSDTANWSDSSGGTTGKSIPGSGTGTTYFRNYYNGSVVLDGAYTVPDHIRIDTKDERPFVWSATDPTHGITSSSELRICKDKEKSPAYLQIESGTYSFSCLRVGCEENVKAGLTINGGSVTATGNCFVGDTTGDNSISRLIVNGGSLFVNADCIYVGENGSGELVVNGGTFQIKSTDRYGVSFGHNGIGTVTLNGGTLITPKFRLDYVQPGSTINFNGGTLKATRSTGSYINASANLLCNIQTGGLIIDTDGHDITIAHDLVGVGGIVKKGAGKLTLTGTNAYAGGISFAGDNSGSVVEGDVTYTASNPKPAAGAPAGLDVSAGGLVAENVVVHGEPLESWLKDSDFTSYSSKYGAQGTAMQELPKPFTVHNGTEEKTYVNLKTGTTYSDTLGGTAFSFTTEALAPRTLRLDRPDGGTVHNVRDVGSWPLMGGRKMNQNVILRGGHLDKYVAASDEQRATNWLTSEFGLKTEIDLRTPGLDGEMPDAVKNLANGEASYSATGAKYYRFPLGWGEGDGTQIGADANGNFTNQVHNFFSTLGTEGALPAYFHCRIGTDRTGIMGMLLLAVMGVEEDVLYRDYLMSNFADIGGSRDPAIPRNFLHYLHRGNCNSGKYVYDNNDYGLSVAARARAYLEMCGVTAEELGRITAALSGETPDQVLARVNAYEQANGCRTVSYVNYAGSSTTNEIHRLPSGVNMLPTSAPTRSGYVFKGWDTDNEIDNGDGTATVYAIWEENLTPLTYQWDNAADNNVFSDGGNWKVKDSDPVVHAKPTAIDSAEVTMSAAHPVLSTDEELEVGELYIGRNSSNYPVLDIEGGKLTVNKVTNLGRYGDRSEVNLRGGEFETKGLIIGNWRSHEYNVFNMSGGTLIAAQRSKWPSDAITLGLQTESKGILNIYGGEIYAQANVNVSFAGMESNIMGNKSVLNVDGGLLSVTGSVYIANNDAHACGQVLVKKGRLETTGSMSIACTSNSWAEVDVSGGTVSVGGSIRVGYNKHSQHAVLKVSGSGVFTDATKDTNYMCFGGPDSVIRLNVGGTLETRAILRDNDANGTVEFNGGKIVKTGDHPWYGGKLIDEHHTISILEGGMIFDSGTINMKYAGTVLCNEGCGGITKLGSSKLTLAPGSGYSCQWNGPISVEEGTLDLSAVTFPEFVDIIRVAEGATLILPRDVTVRVLENAGTITGGTATVEANAAEKVATRAYWTGAAEDGDIRNNKNYIVYDQNGRVIYEQEITDSLRVKVPYGEDLPSFTVFENVVFVVDGTVKAYPDLIKTAAAWYDPSDEATLTVDEFGSVSAIANKGTAENLDLKATHENSRPFVSADHTARTGLHLLAFTNSYGFISNGSLPLTAQQDRVLFTVAGRNKEMTNGVWKENDNGELVAEVNEQMFAFELQSGDNWDGSGVFAIAQWPWGSHLVYDCVNVEEGNTTHKTIDGLANDNGALGVWDLGTMNNGGTVTANVFINDRLLNGNTASDVILAGNYSSRRILLGERKENPSGSQGWVGESLVFDRALTDEEIVTVRNYLKSKWFGIKEGVEPTTLFDCVEFADADSVLDLAWASRKFIDVTGAGRFKDGDVKVTGRITLTVNDDGTIDPLIVDGELDITGATLEILNAEKLSATRMEVPAILVGSVKGAFAAVVGNRRVRVIAGEGELRVRRDDGFAISIR